LDNPPSCYLYYTISIFALLALFSAISFECGGCSLIYIYTHRSVCAFSYQNCVVKRFEPEENREIFGIAFCKINLMKQSVDRESGVG